jgi:signal peptidase I
MHRQSDKRAIPSNISKRKELKGLFNFGKEMISAFGMALLCIVYIVQAFKIPTGSMENSLLVGDQLLGLKFIYGAPVLPFSDAKFPGIVDAV